MHNKIKDFPKQVSDTIKTLNQLILAQTTIKLLLQVWVDLQLQD